MRPVRPTYPVLRWDQTVRSVRARYSAPNLRPGRPGTSPIDWQPHKLLPRPHRPNVRPRPWSLRQPKATHPSWRGSWVMAVGRASPITDRGWPADYLAAGTVRSESSSIISTERQQRLLDLSTTHITRRKRSVNHLCAAQNTGGFVHPSSLRLTIRNTYPRGSRHDGF